MKSKKVLLLMLIALAVTIIIYFVSNYKKNKSALTPTTPLPEPSTPSNGGAATTPAVIITPVQPIGVFPLKMGSKGKAVQIIQIIVGVTPDGIWGQNTQNAVQSKLKTGSIGLMDFLIYSVGAAQKEPTAFPLRQGSKNNYVKALQVIYGLKVDGVYGPNTLTAVLKNLGTTTVTAKQFEELFKQVFA